MTVRVLMVDDEDSLVWSVGQFIRRQRPEWTFEGFTEPLAALARIEASPPDVLITDVRMPKLSGIELLIAARRVAPALPALIVTAYSSQEVLSEVRSRSGVELMEKPVQLDALFAAIDRLLAVSTGFSGDISLPMLPDLLQIYTLSLASGALTVTGAGGEGTIWFERGDIVDATCGALSGDEAVFEVLRWRGGSFRLDPAARAAERRITKSWQHLLLEGCRLIDEVARTQAEDRDGLLDELAEAIERRLDDRLATLRSDLPELVLALGVDAVSGRVVGSSDEAALQSGAASAVAAEVGVLVRFGLVDRIESIVFTLTDELHFLQRGDFDDFVFVATARGPAANVPAIRNVISRRLEKA